jgi:hypothetical protein
MQHGGEPRTRTAQCYIDREPGIRQNPWFTDWLGSGNLDRCINRSDVLHDGEESSRRPKQTKEHVMMVGSWPCKVSSEIHINARRVSEPVSEDKGKTTAIEPEDDMDPKRARVVLSKGREVVELGYSMLTGVAAKVMGRGEHSGNPSRVSRVSQDNSMDEEADRVR